MVCWSSVSGMASLNNLHRLPSSRLTYLCSHKPQTRLEEALELSSLPTLVSKPKLCCCGNTELRFTAPGSETDSSLTPGLTSPGFSLQDNYIGTILYCMGGGSHEIAGVVNSLICVRD